MKSNQILEASGIILGVLLVFVIAHSEFSSYSSYLLAILIIFATLYISFKNRSKPASPNASLGGSASQLFSGTPVELFVITSIIMFIISLTQGLASPLFFFLYFLLFLLAFMCSPITVWVFLASVILYFFPQASENLNLNTFIKLGSLLLISPIAYFIGREFERRQLLNQQIQTKTDEIIQEAQLLKEDGSLKSADETEVIDEIIEEAVSLKGDSEE